MPDPVDHLRTYREVIESAARALRDIAIADNYGDSAQPARTFAVALTLDGLALHLRDLNYDPRGVVVQQCRAIIGRTTESQLRPRRHRRPEALDEIPRGRSASWTPGTSPSPRPPRRWAGLPRLLLVCGRVAPVSPPSDQHHHGEQEQDRGQEDR
jgi:hypothetical protein